MANWSSKAGQADTTAAMDTPVTQSDATVFIANLRDYPQWVSQVALWHHTEWLAGYQSNRRISHDDRDISDDIREREHNLRSHLGRDVVPTTFIAVASHDEYEQAVGSVSVVHYKFSRERAPSDWLTNLYVIPEFRRRGVGQRLLTAMEDYARGHRIGLLKLYTRDLENYYRQRGWHYSHTGLVQGHSVAVLEKRFP